MLFAQIAGVVTVGIFAFAISAVAWLILKGTLGIRVSEEEEIEGLDIGEHGISAYPDFPIPSSMPGHAGPGRVMGGALAYEATPGRLTDQPSV